MANYHVIRTARLTDRQVLDLIDALRGHTNVNVEEGIVSLGDGMTVDILAVEQSEELILSLRSDRHAIQSANLSVSENISVQFFRGVCDNTQSPGANRQASPHFDELYLHAGSRSSVPQWITCIDAIEAALPKTYPFQGTAQVSNVIDFLHAEIASLADQYKEMLDGLAKERTQLRQESEKEREIARQEYTEEREKLNKEREHQRKEFDRHKQQEEIRLKSLREELDRREQDLDDRQHMHARRELRERISADFKKRVGRAVVSRAAVRMRWLVFGLILAAGAGTGYLGFDSFGELIAAKDNGNTSGWLTIAHAARSVLLSALAVGFVVYAISWLRAIYLDDVRAERRYEKYGDDIDRASFVIETILEVGDQENMQVPKAWIEWRLQEPV